MNATSRQRFSNLLAVTWAVCLIWLVAVIQVLIQRFDGFHEFERFLASGRSLWVFWVPIAIGLIALVSWLVVRAEPEDE